jgi:TRAP-type C4-dicarboxylate transport system substrate-binding protein
MTFGKGTFRWAIALSLAAGAALSAQSALIRLGTVAPRSSPWVDALQRMGQTWATNTGKRVQLRVFPDQPSESSVITRMGTGGFDAAALSVVGLADLDSAFNVLAMPFFFESDAEFKAVLEKLEPALKARLDGKGHELILWGHGGWVQVFSKMPIRNMAELQKARLWTSEGDPETEQWYRSNGFHPVPRPAGDIPVQLKLPTGAIDATPAVPPLALAMQFYKDAPYMLDIRVAPLVAGVVVNRAAWQRIAEADRKGLLDAAAATERQLFAQASSLDASHIAEMKKSGLKVTALEPAAAAEFRAAAGRMTASQRGNMVPADVYDLAVHERDAYRKRK